MKCGVSTGHVMIKSVSAFSGSWKPLTITFVLPAKRNQRIYNELEHDSDSSVNSSTFKHYDTSLSSLKFDLNLGSSVFVTMSFVPPVADSTKIFAKDLFKGKVLFCTGGEQASNASIFGILSSQRSFTLRASYSRYCDSQHSVRTMLDRVELVWT